MHPINSMDLLSQYLFSILIFNHAHNDLWNTSNLHSSIGIISSIQAWHHREHFGWAHSSFRFNIHRIQVKSCSSSAFPSSLQLTVHSRSVIPFPTMRVVTTFASDDLGSLSFDNHLRRDRQEQCVLLLDPCNHQSWHPTVMPKPNVGLWHVPSESR